MADDILATVAAQRAAAAAARATLGGGTWTAGRAAAREARIEYTDPSKLYQFAGETFTEAEILGMPKAPAPPIVGLGVTPLEQLYEVCSAELASRDPTTHELLQMAAMGISTIQQGLSRIGEAAVYQQRPIEYITQPTSFGWKQTAEVATGRIDVPARWREPSPYERQAYDIPAAQYGRPPPTGYYIYDPAREIVVPTRELRRGERVSRYVPPYEQLGRVREDISRSLFGVRERFGLMPKEPRFITISGQMLGLKEDVVYSPELRTMVSADYPEELREAWRPPEQIAPAGLAGFIGAPYAAASLLVSAPMFLMKPVKETRAGIKAAQRAAAFAIKEPMWFVGEVGGAMIGGKALEIGVRKVGGVVKAELQDYFAPDITQYRPDILKGELKTIQRIRKGEREWFFERGEFTIFGEKEATLLDIKRVGKMGEEVPSVFVGTEFKLVPDTKYKLIPSVKIETRTLIGKAGEGIDYYLGFGEDITAGYGLGISKIKVVREISKDIDVSKMPVLKGMFGAADELIYTKADIKTFAISARPDLFVTVSKPTIMVESISKPLAAGVRVLSRTIKAPSYDLDLAGLGAGMFAAPEAFKGLREFTPAWAAAGAAWARAPSKVKFIEEAMYIHPDIAAAFPAVSTGLGIRAQAARALQVGVQARPKVRKQIRVQKQLQVGLQTQLQTGLQTQLQTRVQTRMQLQTRMQARTGLAAKQRIKLGVVIRPPRIGVGRAGFIGRPFGRVRRKARPRKRGRRGRVRILADPLSVTITQARLLARGKAPIALHPVQRIARREFFRRGGLRVRTVQMLKERKGRKGKKRRGRRFY